MSTSDGILLEVRNLRKYFALRSSLPLGRTLGNVHAVDDISLAVRRAETLALVGESGCGKTTTARMVLLLEKPTAGDIYFQGQRINDLRGRPLLRYRSMVQAVFQDPWSSLNPRMRIGDFIAEPLEIHASLMRSELQRRVAGALDDVGLDEGMIRSYPHELSGGQRQRVAVARAIAPRPRLIVLDEPVSALDVSTRAQIMNLLRDLQVKYEMSYLLIAHNLATVRYLSHRVAVMYLGQIVEQASADELFSKPLHPYTKALISAAAPARPDQQDAMVLGGDVPSAITPPMGCRLHPRCPASFEPCPVNAPQLRIISPAHTVACHLY